jgi:hypothetical protein
VLCPSTALFLSSFIFFIFGIFTFNSLHTEDIDLVDGYLYFIIIHLICLDWQNALVSLQVTMPIVIWSATLLLPIGHWLLKTFLPGVYWRYRQWTRSQREALRKTIYCRGETVGDIEAGGEAIEGRIDEETPLSTSEGRTQMYGHM